MFSDTCDTINTNLILMPQQSSFPHLDYQCVCPKPHPVMILNLTPGMKTKDLVTGMNHCFWWVVVFILLRITTLFFDCRFRFPQQ